MTLPTSTTYDPLTVCYSLTIDGVQVTTDVRYTGTASLTDRLNAVLPHVQQALLDLVEALGDAEVAEYATLSRDVHGLNWTLLHDGAIE